MGIVLYYVSSGPTASWFDGSAGICTTLKFVMCAGPRRIWFICSSKIEVKRDMIACYKYMRDINAKEGEKIKTV